MDSTFLAGTLAGALGLLVAGVVVAAAVGVRTLRARRRSRKLVDPSLAATDDELWTSMSEARAAHGQDPVAPAEAAPDPLGKALESVFSDEDAAPIVKLANRIVEDAYARGASAIHIEPREDSLVVRYRVDGALEERMRLPTRAAEPLAQRWKVMGGGDLAEKLMPQDCRIPFAKFSRTGLDLDLRLATFPTRHGEACVLRLVAKPSIALGLADLGFAPRNLELVRAALRQRSGVLLFAGYAGSGRTTTFFSALAEVASQGSSVLGFGDAFADHALPGVLALREDPRLPVTRGIPAWRSMDPDAIAVTDLRDCATAEEAFAAAEAGHLVLATITADSAPAAIERVLAIGVEPHVVASSLLLVVAQRLGRRLCACKVSRAPSEAERAELGAVGDIFGTSASGCERCSRGADRGYKGRVPFHEVLAVNDDVRRLVRQASGPEALVEATLRNGLRTFREDALAKVCEGVTDLAEVARAARDAR